MSSAVGWCEKTGVNGVWYMVYTVVKRAFGSTSTRLSKGTKRFVIL